MSKNTLTVSIGGREYTLTSPDNEEWTRRVAAYVDRKIGEVEERLQEAAVAGNKEMKEAVEVLEKYTEETELTQEMVRVLIERVMVYDPEHVEVRWALSDEVIEMTMFDDKFVIEFKSEKKIDV